jgi:hypothetical protein
MSINFFNNKIGFSVSSPITTDFNSDGIEKKKMPYLPKDWSKITEDQRCPEDHTHMFLTGKINNNVVVDIDNKQTYYDMIKEFPCVYDAFKVETYRGWHIYFNYREGLTSTSNVCPDRYEGVDVKTDGGFVFMPPTKYTLDDGSIAEYKVRGGDWNTDMPDELFELLTKKNEKKMKSNTIATTQSMTTTEIEMTSEIEIDTTDMDDLDKKMYLIRNRFGEGQNGKYCKVMYALKNTRGYANGHKASYYTAKYGSENKIREFGFYWNSLKKTDEDKQITLASLDTWCREDNLELFNKWFPDKRSLDNFVEDDVEASEYLLANDLKGICVYSQGNSFIKQNYIWTNDKTTFDAIGMTKTQESDLKKIKINSKGEEIITPYCSNNGSATAVWKTISNKLMSKQDEKFAEKFRSSTKGLLCFKNGVLNFRNGLLTPWIDNPDVYTTNMINYNFDEIQNEENIEKVFDFFYSVFGEQTYDFLHYLGRAIAGHIEDKRWGLFIGSRNCGKGVVERLLRDTFEGYIGSVSSQYLQTKKNADNDVKALGWVQSIEQKRFCILQECDVCDTKLNGVLIKKIVSGGDPIESRTNHTNSKISYIQSTFMMCANLIPPFAKGTEDCMNEAITFTSQNEYVSQDDIDKKRAEGVNPERLALLKVGNPNIKEWFVEEPEMKQALTHLLLRHYKDCKVPKINKFKEDDTTEDIPNLILSHFKYAPGERGNPNVVENKDLKKWCATYGVNYAQQLKPHLINQGGKETNMKINGKSVRGIKDIVKLDVVDDDDDDKE